MKHKIIKMYVVVLTHKTNSNISGLITGFISGIAASAAFEIIKKYLGL